MPRFHMTIKYFPAQEDPYPLTCMWESSEQPATPNPTVIRSLSSRAVFVPMRHTGLQRPSKLNASSSALLESKWSQSSCACFQTLYSYWFLWKLRRQARERRQYVYAKSLEAQERQTYERKRQLKDALANGKQLPTELRKEAKSLGNDLGFDEAQTGKHQQ